MKRILSLTLALVMILGTFTGVFAAEPTVEEAAAKFLAKEEILKGDDNGDLMLKDNLERRDAVILLSRLLGVEEVAAKFPTSEESPSWTDVRTDAYYVPFFAWAEANGYFEGNDDNTFAPREAISAPEYALVLLRALGYEVNGHESWKASLETAEKIGLLKDVEVKFEDKVVRGQMAVMTLNALGTKMKDSDKTLAEELGIELPEEPKAKELTAEVKDTENLAEVVVELSNVDLVKNKEALINPANYRLSDSDVKVYNVDVDGDDVILTLVPYGRVDEAQKEFDANKNVLVKGKKYDLTIRNIDPAINKTYKGILAGDNEIPVVEDVEFMGTYGIKVTTSEPIANPLERNFRLDSRTSMIVEQYGRELILTPYHGRAFDEKAVELVVDKLEDFAKYTSVRSVESMELSTDDAAPVVKEAYRSGSKLTVVFDRDVYHDSIGHYENRRDLGNVSFVERRVTFYAEDSKKVDTNVVEYTFGRDIPRNLEVEIEGVANHFNKAMEKEVIVPVEYKDEYAPVVISSTGSVKITEAEETELKKLDKDALKEKLDAGHKVETQEMTIVFDKDIKEFETLKAADVNVKDHFTLYELDITRRGETAASGVEINVKEVKKDRVTLTFKDIKVNNKDRDFDYILEVRNFSDLNRNRMERDYLDFQVVRIGEKFNVEIKDIRNTGYFNRDGVEIVLEFNDYVNKEEASNARNYYLDGKLKVSEAIVERDGVTVSLVVYDTSKAKLLEEYKVLEISPRVTILDDTTVPADRFFELATRKAIKEPTVKPVESAITYINADKSNAEIKEAVLDVAVDKTTNSKQNIGVTVAAQKDKVLDVTVYKNGKLDLEHSKKVNINTATFTHPIALDKTAKAKYEVTVKVLDGKTAVEEKSLTVNVLDIDVTGTLTYKHSDKVAAVTLDDTLTNGKMELPVTSLSSLKTDDFNVATAAKEVNLELAGSNRQLIVTITAEDGTKAVYNIALEVAAGMVPDSDKKEEAITGITETDVNKLLVRFNDGNESIKSISDYKAWMSQTYGVNFKSENLEIKDGKLIIKGELLSSEDWMTVKSKTVTGSYKNPADIKLDRPYRITLMRGNTNTPANAVFKIAMYGNGSAIVE